MDRRGVWRAPFGASTVLGAFKALVVAHRARATRPYELPPFSFPLPQTYPVTLTSRSTMLPIGESTRPWTFLAAASARFG